MQDAIMGLVPDHDRYLIGFADMGGLIRDSYPYRYAVVVCARLDDGIINGIGRGPTRQYLDLYHRTNSGLNALAQEITGLLRASGVEGQPVPSTLDDSELDAEYRDTLRYSFSHKMAATRAGLGWIGRTGLLVTERFGPRVRMASVLTDYPFENPGEPVTESRCGSCMLCVEKCPAKAANGRLWRAGMDRDEFYDAFRCRDMCRKLSAENLHEEISLCGICVSVCPKGKKGRGGG